MQFKFKRLEVANKAQTPAYEIQAKGGETTIYVYDVIGDMFGISASAFVKDLKAINAEKITLRINSPGGDVFAARAMATALREHPAKVTAVVDGLAASAATTIALAADEVIMAEGSMMMIHNAWTMALGDSKEFLKVADMLEKVNQQIAGDYQKRMNRSYDEIRGMMDEETWFTAAEALDAGLANSIQSGQKASAMWDLSPFANAPVIEEPVSASSEPEFDMAAIRRRLTLLERIA
ncbi:MAG TPA: peptidase S14 [Planctomycetaceae bacterium]|nr:peptidase S14 [Planctomycetaceae bacterium]